VKFLVLWRMEQIEERGAVIARYHLVRQHGGAWISD
jgi:hypothetical protein